MPGPDRRRWGIPSSYKPAWSRRATIAAALVPDGISVLEIGVGTGVFKDLVAARTRYTGADLEPLDDETTALDFERDPLPDDHFDLAVLLGVFTYLVEPEDGVRKICSAADRVLTSYCCRRADLTRQAVHESRTRRGWLNSFDRAEFVRLFSDQSYELASSTQLTSTDEFEEFLMDFRRSGSDRGRRTSGRGSGGIPRGARPRRGADPEIGCS